MVNGNDSDGVDIIQSIVILVQVVSQGQGGKIVFWASMGYLQLERSNYYIMIGYASCRLMESSFMAAIRSTEHGLWCTGKHFQLHKMITLHKEVKKIANVYTANTGQQQCKRVAWTQWGCVKKVNAQYMLKLLKNAINNKGSFGYVYSMKGILCCGRRWNLNSLRYKVELLDLLCLVPQGNCIQHRKTRTNYMIGKEIVNKHQTTLNESTSPNLDELHLRVLMETVAISSETLTLLFENSYRMGEGVKRLEVSKWPTFQKWGKDGFRNYLLVYLTLKQSQIQKQNSVIHIRFQVSGP